MQPKRTSSDSLDRPGRLPWLAAVGLTSLCLLVVCQLTPAAMAGQNATTSTSFSAADEPGVETLRPVDDPPAEKPADKPKAEKKDPPPPNEADKKSDDAAERARIRELIMKRIAEREKEKAKAASQKPAAKPDAKADAAPKPANPPPPTPQGGMSGLSRQPGKATTKRPTTGKPQVKPQAKPTSGCKKGKGGALKPPPEDQPQPKFVCKQPKITLDDLWSGDKPTFKFTIGNEGKGPLQIRLKGG